MVSRLTLFDEQVGEGEHDRVAAVQEVTAHDVRTGDGQTGSRDQLQDSLEFRLGVSIELRERERECS